MRSFCWKKPIMTKLARIQANTCFNFNCTQRKPIIYYTKIQEGYKWLDKSSLKSKSKVVHRFLGLEKKKQRIRRLFPTWLQVQEQCRTSLLKKNSKNETTYERHMANRPTDYKVNGWRSIPRLGLQNLHSSCWLSLLLEHFQQIYKCNAEETNHSLTHFLAMEPDNNTDHV